MSTKHELPKAGELLKIGELARLSGKTVRAIHLYEELALLTPAERSAGGFRLYHQGNLARIQLIDKLQRLGLSLGEIQSVLREWADTDTAPHAMAQLETVYRTKLDETRAAIAELQALERELVDSLDYLRGCRSCGAEAEPVAACQACARPHDEQREQLTLITGISNA